MGRWADYKAWRERRKELVAEDQDRALAREARRVREAFASAEGSGSAVEVRWGQAEDGARIADLLELNGMPRWVAFEELFVVADERGEVTAAVRYRVGRDRLLLGLLVADPWRDGGALAEALYSGVRALAWNAGIPRVVARGPENPHPEQEADFCRGGRDLQADATAVSASFPRPSGCPWRRARSFCGRLAISAFGTTTDEAGR